MFNVGGVVRSLTRQVLRIIARYKGFTERNPVITRNGSVHDCELVV